MSTYRFLATVVISTMLGIVLGSSAYFVSTLFKEPKVEKPVIYSQLNQPILLSQANDLTQVKKEEAKIGEEIIFVEKKEEPSPSPSATPVATLTPSFIFSEATTSGTIATQEIHMEPTPTPTANPAEPFLNADKIFILINQEREKAGLAAFAKDDRVCSVASSRAPEITAEINGGYMHAGFYKRNLPYWAAENIIFMRTEQQAVNWWMNSRVHRGQLMGDFKYSCVACSGQACAQIFTNFTPKQ